MKTNIKGNIAQKGAPGQCAGLKGYLPEWVGGVFQGGVVLIPQWTLWLVKTIST